MGAYGRQYIPPHVPVRPRGMAPPVRNPRILHPARRGFAPWESYTGGAAPPRGQVHLLAMGVKGAQQFLRRAGYHIAADGALGPQTKAAIKAWKTGVNAPMFNRRSQGVHGPSNPHSLTHTPAAPVGGAGGGGGGGGGAGGGAGGGGGYTPPPFDPMGDLIDPNAYAQGSVNAEYGPLLGQVQRDISKQRGQGGQNMADIASWFAQLEKTRAAGQASNEAAGAQSIGDFNTANLGITNALGGAANEGGAQGAGYASAALAGLTGLKQSQGNFDRNMASVLGAQGVDARRTEQGRQSQIMADLVGKRQDLFKAKGGALAKALAEAQILRTQQRGQNIDQAGNLQQQGQAGVMGPLQAEALRQQNRYGPANQKMSLAERQLQYDTGKAQLQDFIDTQKGSNKGFAQLDAQSRIGLSHSIQIMAAGANGNMSAWNIIKSGLASAGYDPKDPTIRHFGLNILATLPGYKPTRGFPNYKPRRRKR